MRISETIKANGGRIILISIPVLALAGIVLPILFPTAEDKATAARAATIKALNAAHEAEGRAEKDCADTTAAFVMSQKFVLKRLKSPASAKFPWMTDSDNKLVYLGGCTHEIRSYVDSQNSFGAMLRSPYYVKLRNEKGTETWTALEVRIGH